MGASYIIDNSVTFGKIQNVNGDILSKYVTKVCVYNNKKQIGLGE